ncbi:DUF3486 family protein [Gluconacetobacter azotocaptans]|uniref:DUF3486 family protein n=1 Tax=Gluconacetobacter azotocaptans TaxID=142834 RepID=UPI00195D66BC|nr:DUF3486 family protein [Gluconacetobacter azotocaptans]MBM9400364.1 DUF3486 family protein [Gluconacetobacter azotocaptans]
MTRPSSVDKLEPEIRDAIGRLRGNGHTIDEILAALRELDVTDISRSALGRHVQKMEKVGARLRHSQNMAIALSRHLGDEPASRIAQTNIQLLHSTIMELLSSGDGDAIDEDGLAALKGNPEGLMLLGKAIDHLTRSSKTDADFVRQIEERLEKRLRERDEKNLKSLAKEKGLSAEAVQAIRQRVLGAGK